jgi:hypothetical protein
MMHTNCELGSNAFPYELQINGDIECYDKIMRSHSTYPKIYYNLVLIFKQKTNEYFNKNKGIVKNIIRKIKNIR